MKRVQRKLQSGTHPAQFSRVSTPRNGRVRLVFFVYSEPDQDAECIATNRDWPEGTAFAKMFLDTFGTTPHGLKGAGFVVKLGENLWNGRNYSTVLEYELDPSFVVPVWAREWMDGWQEDCELKARYIASRLATDEKFAAANTIRKRTWESLVLGIDHCSLLGCSAEELRQHLEQQFQPGMSWANYGSTKDGSQAWTVDHRKALSRFDLTKPEEVKKAAHYSNLQPMWEADNIAKYNTPTEAAA